MNHALGNVEKTVSYSEPVEANAIQQIESLRELVRDMQAGSVDTLVILGGNPAFTAPADLGFGDAFAKVKLRIHLSQYQDETSALCHWHVPEAHFLESWSDCRAYDGTVTILQPLIAPLYGGKTRHEMLASLTSQPDQSSYEIVRGYWQQRHRGAPLSASKNSAPQASPAFELFWRKSLHDGVVAGTALPPKSVTLTARPMLPTPGAGKPGLDVVFRPDPHIHDGQFANNGWLQELPKPHTRLTWDNAALISPATAERLELSNEDVVELQYEGRKLEAPVWILPGQPNDSVTLTPRLRPPSRWTRRTWSRVQHLCNSDCRRSLVWFRGASEQDRTPVSACLYSAPSQHGRAQPRSGWNTGGVSQASGVYS